MANENNRIRIHTSSAPSGVTVSSIDTRQALEVTNNDARYYSDLAKKYKDEARALRDDAKYYAEQNSDVTMLYVNTLEARLQGQIDGKQAIGDYALNSAIPTNVSSLNNDSHYVNTTQMNSAINSVRLPSQTNHEGEFLSTNGETPLWKDISELKMFDLISNDHILSYEEMKGYVPLGEYVYKEAVAGSHYGYPDFYEKCLEEYDDLNNIFDILNINYTVAGNPTITNDKIASGFSSENYITIPTSITASATEIEIKMNKIIPSDFTQVHNVFLGFTLSNHPLRFDNLGYISMYTSTWVNGKSKYNINDSVDVKLIYKNSRCTLYSKLSSAAEYVEEISYYSDVNTLGGTIYLGRNATTITECLTGYIDLKQFSITVDKTITYYAADCIRTNPNGHKFYDISNKSEIDNIYGNTNSAWLYGVDTARERILLPQDDTNSIKKTYMVVGNTTSWSGITSVVNQGMTILEQVNQGIVNSMSSRLDLETSNISQAGKNNIMNMLMPDYSSGITVTSGYEAVFYAYVVAYGAASNQQHARFYVNNELVGYNWNGAQGGQDGYCYRVYISPGDVITWEGTLTPATVKVYPLKGVSNQ